jgi:hypothetical protein
VTFLRWMVSSGLWRAGVIMRTRIFLGSYSKHMSSVLSTEVQTVLCGSFEGTYGFIIRLDLVFQRALLTFWGRWKSELRGYIASFLTRRKCWSQRSSYKYPYEVHMDWFRFYIWARFFSGQKKSRSWESAFEYIWAFICISHFGS